MDPIQQDTLLWGRMVFLPEGDFHFRKLPGVQAFTAAAILSRCNRTTGQLLVAENDQRDSPAAEVLLVSDVLVGTEKHFVTRIFGPLNQLAIPKPMPADPPSIGNFMTDQTSRNRLRGPVVE